MNGKICVFIDIFYFFSSSLLFILLSKTKTKMEEKLPRKTNLPYAHPMCNHETCCSIEIDVFDSTSDMSSAHICEKRKFKFFFFVNARSNAVDWAFRKLISFLLSHFLLFFIYICTNNLIRFRVCFSSHSTKKKKKNPI